MNQEFLIRSLKRQLLIERVLFGAVALIVLCWWAHGYLADGKAFILVNGKPVVCLSSERDARHMLQQMKKGTGCEPSEIEFKEDVIVARAPRDARPVSRHRAMGAVRGLVSPIVPKWSIIVNGRPVVAVPSRTVAGEVLDLAKLKFGKLAKNLCEEPQFKGKVTVDVAAVDPTIYRKTTEEALSYLFEPGRAETRDAAYVVKQGDLAGEIASRSGVKLADLWAMNTGVNLNHLHIGDRIRVRSSVAPQAKLTVIVRDQCERIEPIPPPVQRVSSARMYVGKRVELSPGRSGKRHVKAAAIYENGRKVGSEILEEQILRAPVPRRVAEGIKAR